MIRKDGFGWEIWIFFYCNFMQNGVETIQFSTENISYWDLYFLCYNNECLFKYNLNNYLIHFFLFKCTYIIYRLFFLKTINWKQCRPLIILIGFSFQISLTLKCRQSRLTLFYTQYLIIRNGHIRNKLYVYKTKLLRNPRIS